MPHKGTKPYKSRKGHLRPKPPKKRKRPVSHAGIQMADVKRVGASSSKRPVIGSTAQREDALKKRASIRKRPVIGGTAQREDVKREGASSSKGVKRAVTRRPGSLADFPRYGAKPGASKGVKRVGASIRKRPVIGGTAQREDALKKRASIRKRPISIQMADVEKEKAKAKSKKGKK